MDLLLLLLRSDKIKLAAKSFMALRRYIAWNVGLMTMGKKEN